MYNFNAHTLNGLPVNYSTIPNFALDTVETDTRLNATAKLIYIRLLRYATLIRKVNFKITASWLSDNLAIDRKTVSRSLKSLHECGYLNDDGIILVTGSQVDTPVTLVNDTALKPVTNAPQTQQQFIYLSGHDNHSANAPQTQHQFDDTDVVENAMKDIFPMLGMRRKPNVETTEKGDLVTVGNVPECPISPKNDVPECHISENANGNYAPSNVTLCPSECTKMPHPIKNKGKNKEKNDCTNAQSLNALTSGKGFDRLAEVSNQYKTDSVTNLATVAKTSNGKINFSINPLPSSEPSFTGSTTQTERQAVNVMPNGFVSGYGDNQVSYSVGLQFANFTR